MMEPLILTLTIAAWIVLAILATGCCFAIWLIYKMLLQEFPFK